MLALACVTTAAACTDSTLDLQRPTPTPASGRHKPVTVSGALVAGPAALASFPLLVRAFDDAELSAGVAFADGSDLRFEIAGTELPREVERYDPATGTLVAWVLVPSLDDSGLLLDLFYGGEPSTVDPADVWQDYRAVWHLGEDPVLGVTSDSSPAATHGTAYGFGVAGGGGGGSGPGIAGNAIEFAGSQRLAFGDASAFDVGLDSFSYSAWVLAKAPSLGEFDMALFNGGSSVSYPGFDMELGANNWSGCLNDGAQSVCATVGYEVDLAGDWHHLTFVVDRDATVLNGFIDGTHPWIDTLNLIDSLSAGVSLTVGASDGGTLDFAGAIDEVRIANVARSLDWVATEFANVTSSGLIFVGAEDSP